MSEVLNILHLVTNHTKYFQKQMRCKYRVEEKRPIWAGESGKKNKKMVWCSDERQEKNPLGALWFGGHGTLNRSQYPVRYETLGTTPPAWDKSAWASWQAGRTETWDFSQQMWESSNQRLVNNNKRTLVIWSVVNTVTCPIEEEKSHLSLNVGHLEAAIKILNVP